MNQLENTSVDRNAEVQNAQAVSPVVLVCEHASSEIPLEFNGLGLADEHRNSHAVWDPGAGSVARRMSIRLDAVLVSARVSRLVYDCNRPPHAPDAMPDKSEIVEVPGNRGLSDAEKTARTVAFYEPFRAAVATALARRTDPVLITVHSFTPVYHGQKRDVEIGVLHDRDTRLADALMALADRCMPHVVRRNEPYGAGDGVTHTLQEHALAGGFLNVMLEVRNDLIADEAAQYKMADLLSDWVSRAVVATRAGAC
ncbi:N-formylglutamate amidohydrolase [uncultured Roseobacter sp.]|uniref:N-formylglutamate amidohydrolase n=1 Tax=uncultured Roseobacter sp. TaxID=114847 RepID=UPI00261DFAD6|nr:N-formylglutamate amidohydrolase [uncultured Roseobacter sp.]